MSDFERLTDEVNFVGVQLARMGDLLEQLIARLPEPTTPPPPVERPVPYGTLDGKCHHSWTLSEGYPLG